MSNENEVPGKFKPDRPIILHETNTNFKTEAEVVFAVEQLRARGWLCAYNEKIRPIHLCFNSLDKDFQNFKKDCDSLGVTLNEPVVKLDDFETEESLIVTPEGTNTYEDPSGKVQSGENEKPSRTRK